MKKSIFILLGLLSLYKVNAQCFKTRNHQNTLAFDLQTGGTVFYGDVSRDGFFPKSYGIQKDFGTAFSFTVKMQPRKRLDTRISWVSGTLNGVRYIPSNYQVYFKNEFQEVDLTVAYDPRVKRRKFKKLSTSGVMGLGLINYRTQLRTLRTHKLINAIGYVQKDLGYLQLKDEKRKTDLVCIAGISVSYQIHPNFDLLFEHTYRLASSSKLDAIASGGFNDSYSYTSFGVCYRVK